MDNMTNSSEYDFQTTRRRIRLMTTLFVVVGVSALALLVCVLSGFLLAQREGARRERCEYNLAGLYRATNEYVEATGYYPPAYTQDVEGRRLHSWRVLLLPFLGEEELYSQIRLDEPWDSEWNSQFWTQTPNVFLCTSMPTHDGKEYKGMTETDRCAFSCVLGETTLFAPDGASASPAALVDGASNTILYVERKSPCNWMDPTSDLTFEEVVAENAKPESERVNFGSWHGAGEYVVLCDGATRFLSEKVDETVLRLLLGASDSAELPTADVEPTNAERGANEEAEPDESSAIPTGNTDE